jgi:hypothetical protein
MRNALTSPARGALTSRHLPPRSDGSDHGDVKLIEISEDRPPGQMLDLIYVAEAKLKLVTKYSA